MKAKLLLLALFSIGGCFCTGCGTVLLTDNIPAAGQKGYAEFYCANNTGLLLPITHLDGGNEVAVGNTGTWMANKRRRVACQPGTNTFFIKPASCVRRVDVLVDKDMVTPVRVTYRGLPTIKEETKAGGRAGARAQTAETLHADATIAIEPSLSVTEHEERIRNASASDGAATEPGDCRGYLDAVVLAPEGSRKGYVEFYNDSKGRAKNLHAEIRYRDPKGVVTVRAGHKGGLLRSGVFFDETAKNIFVCPVGTNTFLLSSPRNKPRVDIPVQVVVNEGEVTPVELTFDVQHSFKNDFQDGFWGATRHGASEPASAIRAVPKVPHAPTSDFLQYVGETGQEGGAGKTQDVKK